MEKKHIINFIILFIFLGFLFYLIEKFIFINQTKEFTIQNVNQSQVFELRKDFVTYAVEIEINGTICNDAELVCALRCPTPPPPLLCNNEGIAIPDTIHLSAGNINKNVRKDIYSEPAMVFYYIVKGDNKCSGTLRIRATFVGTRF